MIPEESKAKICFCEKNKLEKLHEHIHQTQLESKYGGFLKNHEHFWPPLIHLEKSHEIKKEKAKKRKYITNFWNSADYTWVLRSFFFLLKRKQF